MPRLDFDMSGIFAKASGPTLHTFTVADVAPASAAERAGIRVGEQIVSVAGRDAAAMTLDDLRIALRGPEHARVQLGLLRAGKRIDVEITLAKRV